MKTFLLAREKPQGKGGGVKSNQMIFIILLATLAGFIGGFVSNQIFLTKSTYVEKKSVKDQIEMNEKERERIEQLKQKRGVFLEAVKTEYFKKQDTVGRFQALTLNQAVGLIIDSKKGFVWTFNYARSKKLKYHGQVYPALND